MAREALQCIKLALNSVSSCMDWLSYGMEPARRYLAVIDAQIYQVLYRRPRVQGAQTPSVTAFLIMLSMADLVLLVLGYPVWFTLYVLSFIGSMLHIATTWVIKHMVVTYTPFLLVFLGPASIVAVLGTVIGKELKFDHDRFFRALHITRFANLFKFVLSIAIGQLVWHIPSILYSSIALFFVIFVIVLHRYSISDLWSGTHNKQQIEVAPVENTCVVCLQNPATMLIRPCRHFCTCQDCINQLDQCPTCRGVIEESEHIFPQ